MPAWLRDAAFHADELQAATMVRTRDRSGIPAAHVQRLAQPVAAGRAHSDGSANTTYCDVRRAVLTLGFWSGAARSDSRYVCSVSTRAVDARRICPTDLQQLHAVA
jgi:hypothetical protein